MRINLKPLKLYFVLLLVVQEYGSLADSFKPKQQDDKMSERNTSAYSLVQGIQEELQLLKGTVQTLVTLVNSIVHKVDENTKNVESMKRKVGDIAKLESTNSKMVISNSKNINANVRKIEKNYEKVNTLTKDVSTFTEYCRLLPDDICGSCTCKDDLRVPVKYYCDCQNLPAKRDCKQYHQEGFRTNGVYKIHQNNLRTIQVYCDQTADGGGWTVIQRRVDGSIKFYRNWESYKRGFGSVQHEFWLGNLNLFTMSLQGIYPLGNELRIELEDWSGEKKFAKYSTFEVGSERTRFQLTIGGASGTVPDGMAEHNGMKFTTFDSDNDRSKRNCAIDYFGAWWYNVCHSVNLNGKYYDFGRFGDLATMVSWFQWHGHDYSLKFVEMKMRRKE